MFKVDLFKYLYFLKTFSENSERKTKVQRKILFKNSNLHSTNTVNLKFYLETRIS